MNDYFGYYTKNLERSSWKNEWRRRRKLKVSEGSCGSHLPCFIVVVLDFDQRLLGNKDKRNWQKSDNFNIWGPTPPGPKWKRAETSGGQIRKGPKPLATSPCNRKSIGFLSSQLCLKFEKDWAKTVVCIVPTKFHMQSPKVDLVLWPRSIGSLLLS